MELDTLVTTIELEIEASWLSARRGTELDAGAKEAEQQFEYQLHALAKTLEPSKDEQTVRLALIKQLEDFLDQSFPDPSQLHVVPFGSFRSSCYSPHSDMDLALSGHIATSVITSQDGAAFARHQETTTKLAGLSKAGCVALLGALADALEASELTLRPVTRVFEPNVPIIKFVDARTGIPCDVSVNAQNNDFKSAVMRLVHEVQPCLTPLTRLVKLWALHHDINYAPDRTFNSWTLELLTVYSMQTFPGCQPRLLPPLWQLFHGASPSLGGTGWGDRPLQERTVTRQRLDEMLRGVETRHRELKIKLAYTTSRGQPRLLDLLRWFLHCVNTIVQHWNVDPFARDGKPCVSTWRARLCSCRNGISWNYRAAVEDPFNYKDNTARSLGHKADFSPSRLPDISTAFRTSLKRISQFASNQDTSVVLAALFGEEAVEAVQDALVTDTLMAAYTAASSWECSDKKTLGPLAYSTAQQEPRKSGQGKNGDDNGGDEDEPEGADSQSGEDEEYGEYTEEYGSENDGYGGDDLYDGADGTPLASLEVDEFLMELNRRLEMA